MRPTTAATVYYCAPVEFFARLHAGPFSDVHEALTVAQRWLDERRSGEVQIMVLTVDDEMARVGTAARVTRRGRDT